MFFVFNKQKIYSYFIVASTIVVLFVVSAYFSSDDTNTVEVTSNIIENDVNNVNNVMDE